MYDEKNYEIFFAERLYHLRSQQGVSAREMSLAIGQNESYINRIENKKALPSMQGFFYICEYLKITPEAFFDEENTAPKQNEEILKQLNSMSKEKYEALQKLISLLSS